MTKPPRKTVLGVDPGLHGALVVVEDVDGVGVVLDAIDLPLSFRNGKNEIDVYALGEWVRFHAENTGLSFAVVEEVGAAPHDGRSSAFNFGKNAGIVHGVLGSFSIPIYFVRPSVWKNVLGLSSNKEESLRMARQLFPRSAHLFSLKRHDGRAEAALLADFGRERFE